jgi:peptidoglycan hydrolase-like protein with peptidoglycan-binding domain
MKQNRLLAISILAAAWVAFNTGPAWAQSTSGKSGGSSVGKEITRPGSADESTKPGTPAKGAGQSDVKDSNRSAGQSDVKGGMASRGGDQWAMQDVKHAQEALKSAGHDPGPIDGKIGPQTRQAIKAFQSSNGLKETGTLDAETAKKLGIDKSGSASGASSLDRGGSSSGSPSSAGKQPSTPSQKESSSPMSK